MFNFLNMENTKLGDKEFLSYYVKEGDTIDIVEMEMLKNNDIDGVLSFSNTQNNDEITFMYDVTKKITLRQFFGGIVRWEDLARIITSITKVLSESEKYMMSTEHFLLSEGQIYVDVETRKAQLIFVPIDSDDENATTWRQFMLNELNNITYDSRDCSENLALLRAYLADESITLSELSSKLKEICASEDKEASSVSVVENKMESIGVFIQDPVVEQKVRNMPKFNTPSIAVDAGYTATQKEKKNKNGISFFGKPKKEKKKKQVKAPSSGGFEIPGQEKPTTFAKLHEKEVETHVSASQVQEIAATELVAEEVSIFKPTIIEKSTGKTIVIDKPEFRIGREPGAVDHVLTNQTVGRLHASIVLDNINNKAFVRDANSKNGTFVNGERIQSNINVPLVNGVVFRLGKEEFIYKES